MNNKGFLIILAWACLSAYAEGQKTATEAQPEKLLQSNNPNYFVHAFPLSDGELQDDQHLEFYLSIKYPLWISSHLPLRFLFIYNGLYDFYIIDGDRYQSAPIISRRQNPGTTLEWTTTSRGQLRLGYFHESNGQILDGIEDKPEFDKKVDQHGKEFALAQVSRGWDYIGLRYQFDFKEIKLANGKTEARNRFHIDLRQYMPKQMFSFDREDDIFWEMVDEQPKIRDYDGLRLMHELHVVDRSNIGLSTRFEFKTGTSNPEALGNCSYRFSLNTKIRSFLITAFYFNGYGKEPSTYNERTEYAGIGLEFR